MSSLNGGGVRGGSLTCLFLSSHLKIGHPLALECVCVCVLVCVCVRLVAVLIFPCHHSSVVVIVYVCSSVSLGFENYL